MNDGGHTPEELSREPQGKSYGEEYLERVTQDYITAIQALPRLSDDEFSRVASQSSKGDGGIGSFLRDFAIHDERIERGTSGRETPPATPEQIQRIKDALPAYTQANPELAAAMNVEETASFRIDTAVDNIVTGITNRLPKKPDEYQYNEMGQAIDTIDVPGLGNVNVTLSERALKGTTWIFRKVSKVKGEQFTIANSRESGVNYRNTLADLSRPYDIEIKPLQLKARLMKHGGINAEYQGEEWDNRTSAIRNTETGRYYPEDTRNILTRVKPQDPLKLNDFKARGEDKKLANWEQLEDQAIKWLGENVAKPLSSTQTPSSPTATSSTQ